MVSGKMQKPHPSRYGRWIKIPLNPAASYEYAAVPKKQPPAPAPQESSPSKQQPAASAVDPELKRLDEILGAASASEEEPQHQPSATFEEDESLEALDSVISGIRQKTQQHSKNQKVQDQPRHDAEAEQKTDPQIDISKLENHFFTPSETGPEPSRLQSIEEIEEQYLRELETRYEQEKQ